jgi:putative flippase GtrA
MIGETGQQFLRFGVVGAAGFSVDAVILYFLISAGVDPYLARVLSFAAAVSVTWTLNRAWTFKSAPGDGRRNRYARYLAVQIAAVLVNYVCYAAVLSFISATPLNAVFALAVGSAVGLAVNFTGAKGLVFND